MSFPKAPSVSHNEKRSEIHTVDAKHAEGNVVQVQTASVALAAAIAAQKPSLFSKNMIKLYAIMSVGYLVSTLNGFGLSSLIPLFKAASNDPQIPR
jgi:hypothetical protein